MIPELEWGVLWVGGTSFLIKWKDLPIMAQMNTGVFFHFYQVTYHYLQEWIEQSV